MSLRSRITLATVAIVAFAIIGGAVAAQYATMNGLQHETDRFLVARAQRIDQLPLDTDRDTPFTLPNVGRFGANGSGSPSRAFEFDAVTQLIDQNGLVVSALPNQRALPVSKHDIQVAAGQAKSYLHSVEIDNVDYRVITAPVPGGAIQIGRALTENSHVLRSLRIFLVFLSLFGALTAALVTWLMVHRAMNPIEALTTTAENIAETQDLTTPIANAGSDEVGRLATSFNTMLSALASSKEQQKRLVVDASHELRTPLTALRTNIDVLQRSSDKLSKEDHQRLVSETQMELEDLTNLVSELVELATDVRLEEPIDNFELADVANKVAERFERRAKREINVSVSDDDNSVEARRGLVERAVSNLVDNALKFSPPDTAVDVSVAGKQIEVCDRGPGIPEADAAHIFDRFYRAGTSRTLPGSGLGLAIVKQIVELHNGTVEMSPRDGGGNIARITFP